MSQTSFIAAAALVATQWQLAHAQTIPGSIPEEFRGDRCPQENANDLRRFLRAILDNGNSFEYRKRASTGFAALGRAAVCTSCTCSMECRR
jgi:hypothetical protein